MAINVPRISVDSSDFASAHLIDRCVLHEDAIFGHCIGLGPVVVHVLQVHCHHLGADVSG